MINDFLSSHLLSIILSRWNKSIRTEPIRCSGKHNPSEYAGNDRAKLNSGHGQNLK